MSDIYSIVKEENMSIGCETTSDVLRDIEQDKGSAQFNVLRLLVIIADNMECIKRNTEEDR